MEQEASEGDEVQACRHGRQPLVVAGQAAETGHPGEAALDLPARGSTTKPRLASGNLTTSSWMPCPTAVVATSSPV